MAAAYSFKHKSDRVTWDNPTHTRIKSIEFEFQVAGGEVTKHEITSLYPELLKQLNQSKAFNELRTSDNLEIEVSNPDNNGAITVKLVVKNSPYASIGNARQTALDTIQKVFDTRFTPRP